VSAIRRFFRGRVGLAVADHGCLRVCVARRLGDNAREYRARRPAPSADERDAKMDAMANAASRPESLTEHLLRQWVVLELDEETRRAGEAIIYSLEDDGYLKVRLAEIVANSKHPLEPAVVEKALRRVQRLDPVGVAARDYGGR